MITAKTTITMIKRILLMLILGAFLAITSLSLAQEEEKTDPSPSTDAKVQQLKEKLATKVAELRESQKRGYFGEIAAISKTTFTLVTREKTEIKVKFDENTRVYKIGKSRIEGTSSDVKNGLSAAVLGLYDEENKQHTAKVILIQPNNKFASGLVVKIDKTNGTLTIKDAKGDEVVIEYEKTTLSDEYTSSNKKIKKSGLSRFTQGDNIQVWGAPHPDDVNNILANRILRISADALQTEDVAGAKIEASASATPKTSPKASPKATPKASPKE